MLVFCIVVTYNGLKWIDRCLMSLTNSKFAVNIIVIDNASTDGTPDFIRQNFPGILLIQSEINLGFGKANNIGIKKSLEAGADYIFLLNQDAWIKENTIDELLNAAKYFPDFGILSPFHLDVNEKVLEKQFVEFLRSEHTDLLISDMFFNDLKTVHKTTYIHAAAWFMSRICIETVGGFDPLYFHYGEDDDYLRRTHYFNFKIGLVPSALIVHDITISKWEIMEWNENRNMVVEYHKLKRMTPHFRTNLLTYFKSSFDELTTYILYRQFRKLKFRAKMMYKAIRNIRVVHNSYKQSFRSGAFLK